MASLRQLISQLRHNGSQEATSAPSSHRFRPDRRKRERRDNKSESRTYQEELAENEARLTALINSTMDGILSIDTDQRIVLINPAACRMFCCRPEKVIGTYHERFIPERFRQMHREHIQRFIETGITARAMGQAGTFLGLRETGEEFPIEATISKARVSGKWQLTVIVRDVTERKAAEEALRRSQEDLEMAVRSAAIGTWNWNLGTGMMILSDRCRELFGITPDEPVTLDRFLEALNPEQRESARATVKGALERHEEYNLEHAIRLRDGRRHWVAVVGRGNYDEETGTVVGMSGIALDITERKEIENTLRENEELMRLANEAANIGTYDTDLETGRTRLSPELCAILGLPPGTEKTLAEITESVFCHDRERMSSSCRNSADPTGNGLIRSEHRIVRPDGEVRWLVWRGRTLFRDTPTGRRPTRNIGACFDITDLKRLEEALQGMNEALEHRVEERTLELSGANEELVRSNLELQQFAYIAAHDLQTPLRSISGFAQLLLKEYRGRLDDQADLWISQLVHHVERMHDMIQDLLAYSGVDSQGRPFEPTDLDQLLAEVLDTLEPAIRESGVKVTREALPMVIGDRVQLAQVLQNLLNNGIKYRNGEEPQIHVSARQADNEWIISVRDNGIGIAKKHHDRIFDIFRRLHSQQAYPGTGIGLAICRRVVQRHGGRIWLDSEPGQGADFQFTLPVGGPSRALSESAE